MFFVMFSVACKMFRAIKNIHFNFYTGFQSDVIHISLDSP